MGTNKGAGDEGRGWKWWTVVNSVETNIEVIYVIFHLMLIGISGVQQIPCQSVPTNCGPPL